ncbi:hypothetical protein SCAR479_11693 [Seiridium cardinale]|uniref:Uncharacterized protein n=1 Tax=Seiridium cardinale TaxID=138064 RepID=A0ABR2XD73_9PEZI
MPSSTAPLSSAWAAIKRHAKEHHDSVNAAYTTYYGINTAPQEPVPTSSSSPSPAPVETAHRSSVDKAWSKVKKHAKEHHDSVNAAYTTYYGIATPRVHSPASSVETTPRVSADLA